MRETARNRRPIALLRSRTLRRFAWLTTVAVHEAWQQRAAADEIASQAELPELIDPDRRGTEDEVLERLEHRERFQALHALKPAEREALYLKGLGYTYEEVMRLTGASYTAVNRRITEGPAALRRELGEDSGPRRWAPRRAADAPASGRGGEDRSATP